MGYFLLFLLAIFFSVAVAYSYEKRRCLAGTGTAGSTPVIREVLFCFLLLLLPFLLTAFRSYSVGTDTWDIYYSVYYYPYCVEQLPYHGQEFGFYWIMRLADLLFGSYLGVMVFTTFLVTAFSVAGLYYYRDRLDRKSVV